MVVLAIAAAAIGFVLPKGVFYPQYKTTTAVGAPPVGNSASSDIPAGVTTDQIQYFAVEDSVFTQAAALAHIDQPQYVLRGMIAVSGPCSNCSSGGGLPGIVNVTVTAPTAAESATLNVAFDNALAQGIENGAKLLNNGNYVNTGFTILETTEPNFAVATTSKIQSFNSRPVRVITGALIGLILGILVALVRMLLDKRVTSGRRAQAAIGYPIVGEIPASTSESGEAYRMLWLSVFREPLPEPVDQVDPWLDGVDLMTDDSWPGLES
jgi:hypothetical protein